MVLVLQQSGPPERFGGDLYIRGRAVPGDTWLLPSSTVPLSSSFWHTGMCVAYGWHHAVITHAPKYRKYWASLSGTALVVSLNLFLRLWLYASCSRAPSCTGPRMRLMCVWWEAGWEPGGSAWETGGEEAAVQTEGFCSEGCWASSALTKQPVSGTCVQPGGIVLS